MHVHSTLSHDGTLTIPELAAWFRPRGYQFVAIGEHSQDMDAAKIAILKKQCAENSDAQFCMIPGIEFSCQGGLHIFGVGATELTAHIDPVKVAEAIRAQGGFVILAHPNSNGLHPSREAILAVDAVEIWNLAYDGKFLPSPRSLTGFYRSRSLKSDLLAVAGHDFHRKVGFYDASINMGVPSLSPGAILQNLHEGRYSIDSRLFRTSPRAAITRLKLAWWLFLSWPINQIRKVKDLLVG